MRILNLISGIILAVGGLNWGLVGVGNFIQTDLNLVRVLFGSIPPLENSVYILVGLSAIAHSFTCISGCIREHCKKK